MQKKEEEKRKKNVGDKKKKKKRRKKGKCMSVIGVVKSRLVDRVYILIFFSSRFSLFLSSFCQLIDFRMSTNVKNKVNWLKTKNQNNELINKN
jgi:hypothetical protein